MPGGLAFLVLEARFLAGTYGGVEWPPSPFRLLQAIVAGCRSSQAPGLAWLERQPPPLILATEEPAAVRFKRSIPNNADPRKPSSALSLRDIVHRRVEQPVRYCYPLRDETDRAEAIQLIGSAAAVHTLGVGEDMCAVQGAIVDSVPESLSETQLWLPSSTGDSPVWLNGPARLRCPVPGSLASLEARFQAFQSRLDPGAAGFARPVSAPGLHRTVEYATSDSAPRCAVVVFRLVTPGDLSRTQAFRATDAVVVGGMLRHAAMGVATAHAADLDDFAAGYGPDSDRDRRLSWVPLPSIGHAHADGWIRRGLWLCRAQDAMSLGRLISAVGPDGLPLTDEATGECGAIALPVDPSDEPVLRGYLSPSASWVSVTPVILPGDNGEGNLRVMTKLAHKAVREAGIDPGLVASVEFSKSPYLRQAARIPEVRLKDWAAKRLILYHLRIRFRRAIRGPVVLGRGRHFGLGLMCAIPE